ncbi:MAG: methylenetetrahydrofolate reductase [NAD(P)H] [Flavobacteriales bacterium]|nr:methylenetetrahydrofolate reductase [NAD(P)H] [Flavobacteriales bacterium]MBK6944131.1 methylenetetrahydrofolate reductase [NAD(P)H] [Flavobacteriales bacterium]MBK7240333.1 methylenetetrahydrofolate reductase [NAD(P)H] [Flavobacteriales bacterium]MBK7295374.1 methylenetetrahydrofolate reductase [NAD(P)H] [Flavobacteriales bacterium]MBK9533799.1 methylenetetrahydrofolate reductase [NAD(P)H] [Flavobacteriales bacterium]
MKVIDHLKQAKKRTLFSFEILPPLKGKDIHSIYEGIDPLLEFKPSFINVTYHREEVIYKERGHGLLQKIRLRKRPGTIGICATIKTKYDIDTVPHLICGGFSREETEDALIELNFLGIDNVLALRGDAIKNESHFIPEREGHPFAVDLIRQAAGLNKGQYLHDEEMEAAPTDLCIGAACYPEKHPEALNLNVDVAYLKNKVDAGAEYLVTQMFFDNTKYFSFVEQCRAAGITVPIIPGLKPITTMRHIAFLPKTFRVDLPDAFAKELVKCKTNDAVKAVGVEWSIAQSKELMAKGAPCLHYYTMGKSDAVKQVVSSVF